jgi:hypothetical protein
MIYQLRNFRIFAVNDYNKDFIKIFIFFKLLINAKIYYNYKFIEKGKILICFI